MNNLKNDLVSIPYFQKVFHIKVDDSTGTSFVVEHGSKGYLVTARHIFTSQKNGDTFTYYLMHNGQWLELSGQLLLHENSSVDIAVIMSKEVEESPTLFNLRHGEIFLGDNGYFFGFPYGMNIHDESQLNSGFPLPLIKSAILSAAWNEKGVKVHILDGHNNPGFSGGPLIFRNRIREEGESEWGLRGVVSAYVTQNNKLKTPFGELSYQENSGLIVAYPSNLINEIFELAGL